MSQLTQDQVEQASIQAQETQGASENSSDILTDAKNVSDSMAEEVTRVTSIAEEEAKTGQKIAVPTPEELVAKSSMSIIANRKHLGSLLPKLGKKAKDRLILALLDLPADGQPVKLVSSEEKVAYRLGQSIVRAMFTVMFYHTSEEIIKKHKAEQANKQEEKCEDNQSNSV
jgi:hypothetical protein